MTDKPMASETLIERAFEFLTRKYVQRADERQKAMGLQYTEAETHDLAKEVAGFTADTLEALQQRVDALEKERDTPQVVEYAKAVQLEAWHQRNRWGSSHDAGKTPFDWFWLIGYLAQKAAHAAVQGDAEKALHHTISTGAALANWHLALSGGDASMRRVDARVLGVVEQVREAAPVNTSYTEHELPEETKRRDALQTAQSRTAAALHNAVAELSELREIMDNSTMKMIIDDQISELNDLAAQFLPERPGLKISSSDPLTEAQSEA